MGESDLEPVPDAGLSARPRVTSTPYSLVREATSTRRRLKGSNFLQSFYPIIPVIIAHHALPIGTRYNSVPVRVLHVVSLLSAAIRLICQPSSVHKFSDHPYLTVLW